MLDALVASDLGDGANDHGGQGSSALRRFRAFRSSRGTALVVPISARASTARSLTHQSRIPRGLDQLGDRALILGLIEDLDRGAPDVLVVVLDERQDGVHHARTPDLAQVRRRRACVPTSRCPRSPPADTSPTSSCRPTFSTSTAARRAYSFSSLSTSTRYLTVSGWLARTTTSTALFCTSSSGIAQHADQQAACRTVRPCATSAD